MFFPGPGARVSAARKHLGAERGAALCPAPLAAGLAAAACGAACSLPDSAVVALAMPPTTLLEVQGGVAVITLSNPPVNALHPDGEPAGPRAKGRARRLGALGAGGRVRLRRTAAPQTHRGSLPPLVRSALVAVQPRPRGTGEPTCEGHRGDGRKRWGRGRLRVGGCCFTSTHPSRRGVDSFDKM